MRDTQDRFGPVSITLHWLAALAYFGLFGLGAYMVTLGYYDPLYTRLPYWHKALGVLLIFVVLVRLAWRVVNSRPEPLPSHRGYERVGASLAHWGMNIGFLIVLFSGYLITTSAGAGIDVFETFTLPAVDLDVENQEDTAGLVHQIAAYIVLGIAIAHAIAALKHHFIDRDATLKRILPTIGRQHETD